MVTNKVVQEEQCQSSEERRIILYIEKKNAYLYGTNNATTSANDDSHFAYNVEKNLEHFADAMSELSKH